MKTSPFSPLFVLHFLLYSFSLIPVKSNAQHRPQQYKIYDTAKQREINIDELVKGLEHSDVVFFGEEHNDSVAHVLELFLLQKLHRPQKSAILSLEMFQSDTQLILDEYLAGKIRETNLKKDGRLWSNYDDYRPLVEYAKEHGLAVLAANAPTRYTNLVSRDGLAALEALSYQAKSYLAPLPIDTLTGSYHQKFTDLLGAHEGMGELKIYQSQNLWDATMASRIGHAVQQHENSVVLHINGRFHSDEKLGTVAQLKNYAPHLNITNISAFSHPDFNAPDWENLDELADYVILTNPDIKRTF